MTAPTLADLRARVVVRDVPGSDSQTVWLGSECVGHLVPLGDGYVARGVAGPVSREDAIDHMLAEWRVSQERPGR